jgi:hypothetical protein
MSARTVIVQVAYRQYYLRDLVVFAEIPDEVFTGGNGLVSVPPGIAGLAVVHAGTHTGPARVTVQAHTDPPTQTDLHAWEEVVEVSFTAVSGQVLLTEWDGPGHEDLGSVAGPRRHRPFCGRLRPQPQRRPGGLHRLLHHRQQLGGQGVQVELLAPCR